MNEYICPCCKARSYSAASYEHLKIKTCEKCGEAVLPAGRESGKLTRPGVPVTKERSGYIGPPISELPDKYLDILLNGPTRNGFTKDLIISHLREIYAALMKHEHPAPMPTTPERDGLKVKYDVFKVDSGEPVFDCFVLRPDRDAAARAALRAYAEATTNEALAYDLIAWVDRLEAGAPE